MPASAVGNRFVGLRTVWSAIVTSVVGRFVFFSLIIFVIGGVWSVTTPLGSGPDEVGHMATAYAVTHGQIASDSVTVPEYIRQLGLGSVSCFVGNPDQAADCQVLSQSTTPMEMWSQFGTYFPVYYYIVGFPTLFLTGTTALYAMRLVSAGIFAILVGIALTLVLSPRARNKALAIGIVCALTPMTIFLAGVVSSSSFEIAAAILTWVTALLAFPYGNSDTALNHRKVSLFVISACIFLVTRMLSPIWLAIVVVSVLSVNGAWCRFWRLFSKRIGWLSVVAIVAVGIVVGIWDLLHPNTYLSVNEAPANLADALAVFWNDVVWRIPLFSQMAAGGILGWLDTNLLWAPYLVYAAWALVVGLALGRTSTRTREILTIVVLTVVSGVLPAALESIFWGGTGWQGRYSLPFLIGIPMVAASIVGRREDSEANVERGRYRGAFFVVLALMGVAGIYAILINYHRYSVGMSADFDAEIKWTPSRGFWLPFIAYCFAWVALVCSSITWRSKRHANIPQSSIEE